MEARRTIHIAPLDLNSQSFFPVYPYTVMGEKKQMRKSDIIISVLAGLAADGMLRLANGSDGNLLVHRALFFLVAAITFCLLRLFRSRG